LAAILSGGCSCLVKAQKNMLKNCETLLFAPLFKWQLNKLIRFASRELCQIYYEWINKNNPGNLATMGFSMPACGVLLDLGQQILKGKAEIT
jgi:hypothetical protein